MAPPRPPAPPQRRPKIEAPPFDIGTLRGALIELLTIAAAWERGASKPRGETEERIRARREDEEFLATIAAAVHAQSLGALLALSDRQQIIPYDRHLVLVRKALATELRRFRRGESSEDALIVRLREIIGERRASDAAMRTLIGVTEMSADGNIVRDVHKWIKKNQGPQGAAAKLISHFMDRAGRFTFAAEKAVREQPFGAGAVAVRSRGVVVMPIGTVRYLLQCLAYPDEKIEAVMSVLHGPKPTPSVAITSAPSTSETTPRTRSRRAPSSGLTRRRSRA